MSIKRKTISFFTYIFIKRRKFEKELNFIHNKNYMSHRSKSKKNRFSTSRIKLPKKLIEDRINYLMEMADTVIVYNLELAQRYAKQARNIQKKTRVKFPQKWKKRFCKHCKTFLYPGINSRVRLSSSNKTIVIYCNNCSKYTRIPYRNRGD